MTEAYDHITAKHYSAFRPSLHRPILGRCILGKKKYALGLDIGCGTGQSSIALAHYCDKVFGIDPSEEMLGNSIKHPKVEYCIGDGKNLNFETDCFDIITFAGSLYYAKSQKLLDEVIRVGKPSTTIIIYDFEILLADVLDGLKIRPSKKTETAYNPKENFSGLANGKLKLMDCASEQVSIRILPTDLSHLILSEKSVYKLLRANLGSKGLYDQIKDCLVQISGGKSFKVNANIFYSIYEYDK